jgi:hypothetical protein
MLSEDAPEKALIKTVSVKGTDPTAILQAHTFSNAVYSKAMQFVGIENSIRLYHG